MPASMHHATSHASASRKAGGARLSCSAVMLSSPVVRFVRNLAISFCSSIMCLITSGPRMSLHGTWHVGARSISLFFAATHCRVVTWVDLDCSPSRMRSLSSSCSKSGGPFAIVGLSFLFTIFHISDVLMFCRSWAWSLPAWLLCVCTRTVLSDWYDAE